MLKSIFTLRILPFFICTLANLLFGIKAQAQTPQAFPYQSVLRDASGNLLANQNVALRFSILSGGATGTLVYQETQTATTNSFGLFDVNIGQGTVSNGTFANINWGNGSKYLKIELDATGGSNYVQMDNAQLLSVPYALHAAKSGNLPDGIANGNTLHWNGTAWIADNTIQNDGTKVGIGIAPNRVPLNVFGAISAKSNRSTHNIEGAYLEWDKDTVSGRTYLLNQRGNGQGGFVFAEVDTANNLLERMNINATGNIGIGTINPTSKLHIANSLGGGNFDALTLYGNGTGFTYLNIIAENNNDNSGARLRLFTKNAADNGIINADLIKFNYGGLALNNYETDSAAFTAFRIGNYERMRILSSGNVGIGTTNPSAKLSVSDTSGGIHFNALTLEGTGTGLTFLDISGINNTDHSGSVLRFISKNVADNGTTSTDLVKHNSGGFHINNYETDPAAYIAFAIGTSTPDRLFIGSSGNIGIGTNAPNAKLEVAGQVKITGGSPANGKVLTSDANGLATWQTPTMSNTHYVGESYGGGIVFYVYDNGQHGLIAATSDIVYYTSGLHIGLVQWSGHSGSGYSSGIRGGIHNSLIEYANNNNDPATLCIKYHNTTGLVYGDWYLPSYTELQLLYDQRNIVGGFYSGTVNSFYGYLSSEFEPSSGSNYCIHFTSGASGTLASHFGGTPFGRVRAIRSF